MAKKGRKKTKALKKKSPEEEKAEIVAILMTKCGKEEEEVTLKTNIGIFKNLTNWDSFSPKIVIFSNLTNWYFSPKIVIFRNLTSLAFQEALLPNPLLQVLKAWDNFHDMYPDGFVSREDFLASRSVILNFKLY